jgi:hypothetical protein
VVAKPRFQITTESVVAFELQVIEIHQVEKRQRNEYACVNAIVGVLVESSTNCEDCGSWLSP